MARRKKGHSSSQSLGNRVAKISYPTRRDVYESLGPALGLSLVYQPPARQSFKIGRPHAASEYRPLVGTRPSIPIPDPSSFERNQASRLTMHDNDPAKKQSSKTREYPTCKKRPDGKTRSGKGGPKKFVPWC